MGKRIIINNQGFKCIAQILIPYILIVGSFQYFAMLILGINIHFNLENLNIYQNAIIGIFTAAGTFLVVWFFNKYVDGRGFKVFQLNTVNATDLSIGLILGILVMTFGFVILIITKQIFLKSVKINVYDFVFSVIFFFCVSFSEEFIMRGYVLNNLLRSFNKYIALSISALLFSMMHLANPNINWISFFDIFLAGILLGLFYIYTSNLWFSFGLHFTWNFFQGTVYGFSVSGIKVSSIFNQGRIENNIWNGGAFGFEGSILSILMQIICIVAIYLHFEGAKIFKKNLSKYKKNFLR